MKDQVLRKLFLGFVQIHILYHAGKEPIFGLYMIEELKRHGYEISPGTLYPLLHSMESKGLLKKQEEVVEGKVRKYYTLTAQGQEVLEEAREKALELFKEIQEI
ncbi:PadR family transcriptional regulator [Candidatus Contubernalis alkaliaceticus]|uniref:PadR family transcriptional regulator n=1 Tax=Candidatus Contubernalis alkaliaceticus TaxID=338645 RepID=UPI001F4C3582|nr:PadR family transcriptional regulator [Candidatus Contubernalis alkalaceticus]UNC92264.1 helix-turn-helix transcriptional regulator [Candidatus Contubernalis alkalaceticus]